MFLILKQGLVLKKKDTLKIDPSSIPPIGTYILCSKPGHQENSLNIICFNPNCPQKGLICSACFFEDHISHSALCSNLKDFLKNYKDFLQKEKETCHKEVKEEEIDALKKEFTLIAKLMNEKKQKFEEEYSKLETSLKQKEQFWINSLQKKNLSDLADLITNLSQGSVNTVIGYNEAMDCLLEGLSGSLTSGLNDEKLKQDLMPNHLILQKVNRLKHGLEAEFMKIDTAFNKALKNCNDLILEKTLIKPDVDFNDQLAYKYDIKEFLPNIIHRNIRISDLIRLYKGTEDGFQKKELEKRLEGKNEILVLVNGGKEAIFGIYMEAGLKMEKDKKYTIFSMYEKKIIKEGRYWGGCFCSNKEKIMLTNSNLHEVIIFEEGNRRDDNYLERNGKIVRFRVIEIEIYEIIE